MNTGLPFEAFIERILKQQEQADMLRNIITSKADATLPTNDEGIECAVDNILFEAELSSKFSSDNYDTDLKKTTVMARLVQLNCLLMKNKVKEDNKDFVIVQTCIHYVSNDWSLTPDVINTLNNIYKKYD